MIPILYEKEETAFKTNGIGRLYQATVCRVSEVRNGVYELNMSYPITGRYYSSIKEDNIILATHDPTYEAEPFDIYEVSKPSAGFVQIKARHIVYRLADSIVKPFGNSFTGTADAYGKALAAHTIGGCPFSFSSDIKGSKTIAPPLYPVSIWSCMGEKTGDDILSIWGGEWEYKKFNVSLKAARGSDNGVVYRRGSVTSMTVSTTIENLVTGIVPYAITHDAETDTDVLIMSDADDPTIYYPDAADYQRKTIALDFSTAFEVAPTVAELEQATKDYIARDMKNTRNKTSYQVSIAGNAEAVNLRQVGLCDVVHVYDDVLGIEDRIEVTGLVWDTLADQAYSVNLGDTRALLSTDLFYANRQEEKTLEIAQGVSTEAGSDKIDRYKRDSSWSGASRYNAKRISDLNQRVSTVEKNSAAVTVTPALTSGTKIATIGVGDHSYILYAPESGGSGGGGDEVLGMVSTDSKKKTGLYHLYRQAKRVRGGNIWGGSEDGLKGDGESASHFANAANTAYFGVNGVIDMHDTIRSEVFPVPGNKNGKQPLEITAGDLAVISSDHVATVSNDGTKASESLAVSIGAGGVRVDTEIAKVQRGVDLPGVVIPDENGKYNGAFAGVDMYKNVYKTKPGTNPPRQSVQIGPVNGNGFTVIRGDDGIYVDLPDTSGGMHTVKLYYDGGVVKASAAARPTMSGMHYYARDHDINNPDRW